MDYIGLWLGEVRRWFKLEFGGAMCRGWSLMYCGHTIKVLEDLHRFACGFEGRASFCVQARGKQEDTRGDQLQVSTSNWVHHKVGDSAETG